MMCLLVEIHDMCLRWIWKVELSGRAQVIVVVKDLCLRPLICQSCAVVPFRPYSAHYGAFEEYVWPI